MNEKLTKIFFMDRMKKKKNVRIFDKICIIKWFVEEKL